MSETVSPLFPAAHSRRGAVRCKSQHFLMCAVAVCAGSSHIIVRPAAAYMQADTQIFFRHNASLAAHTQQGPEHDKRCKVLWLPKGESVIDPATGQPVVRRREIGEI